jgi:REP element-mobilizing transposase RayT
MNRPRIQVPGIYHVNTRGNDGAKTFRDVWDFAGFFTILEEVIERMGWRCHAYVLMTNHYHLIIETFEENLAAGMQLLNRWYSQRFNRRHDRTNHVFGAPYWSELVTSDEQLLENVRYVLLNPVRARICDDPADWPASSYNATVGTAPVPPFLSVDEVLALFHKHPARARIRFAEFVRAPLWADAA